MQTMNHWSTSCAAPAVESVSALGQPRRSSLAGSPMNSPKHGSPSTLFDPRLNTYWSPREIGCSFLTWLFWGTSSWEFLPPLSLSRNLILVYISSFLLPLPTLLLFYIEYFLKPSICNLKKPLVAHEYSQMLLKRVYQAYETSDTRIVELFEHWRDAQKICWSNLAIFFRNYLFYSPSRQSDSLTLLSCSHRLRRIWEFFPYEPTFYKLHLSLA